MPAKIAKRPAKNIPAPLPPLPPGPTHVYHRGGHGASVLSLLLLVTVVVFMALGTGLSVVNVIEISKLKNEMRQLQVLSRESAAKSAVATAAISDPDQALERADELINQADAIYNSVTPAAAATSTN